MTCPRVTPRPPARRRAAALVLAALALGGAACAAGAGALVAPSTDTSGGLPPEGPQRRALLVGVTEYPALARERWLTGPANDVALVGEILTSERFGFPREHVVALAGWPAEPERRPTRANIEREFRRLADLSRPGDLVVLLLSSHGSQQPADDDPADPEPDGLDEIFLPADVQKWSGARKRVENAIVDDELRAWIAAIRNRGAFVWAIIDTCHAGTMVRGAPAELETERQIPPEELVPPDLLAAVVPRAGAVRTALGLLEEAPEGGALSPDAADAVATYAAQSYELAPEMPLPPGGPRKYGLFTYTVAQVLVRSRSPLTYRELIERVNASYRAMGRAQPVPVVEGRGMDRAVLGLDSWPQRPRLLLGERVPGGVELRAGSLHGLRPRTVLAVYPPAGAAGADRPYGHVVVQRVEPLRSVAAPAAHGSMPVPALDRLVAGSRGEPVYVDYGDMRLHVALQTTTGTQGADPVVETHPDGSGPPALEASLREVHARLPSLVERVAAPAGANWFVRAAGGEVLLVPASGWATGPGRAGPGVAAAVPAAFRVGRLDAADLATRLTESLERIARASGLLRLADDPPPLTAEADHVDVSVEVLLLAEGAHRGEPVPFGPGGRVLEVGDRAAFRVKNPSRVAIDVTLLFVGSDYGILDVFPTLDSFADNRLGPGQSIDTRAFRVTNRSLGREQVIAIAVKAGPERIDFAHLRQSGLEATRQARSRSPLAALIDQAAYGGLGTRSLEREEVAAYAVRLVGWTVRSRPE